MTVPEVRPSYLVGRIERLIRARFDEALAGAGLTLAGYTALSVLAARPGLSNARLARRSLVSPQAMNKVMLTLERQGLVIRSASPEGGRVLGAELTDRGHATFAALAPLIQSAEDQVLAPLDADDRAELIRLLGRVSGLDAQARSRDIDSAEAEELLGVAGVQPSQSVRR